MLLALIPLESRNSVFEDGIRLLHWGKTKAQNLRILSRSVTFRCYCRSAEEFTAGECMCHAGGDTDCRGQLRAEADIAANIMQ